jgi:hypothetical protein
MLTEAVNEMLTGDLEAGKAMLRDYINANITFEKLAKKNGEIEQKHSQNARSQRKPAGGKYSGDNQDPASA